MVGWYIVAADDCNRVKGIYRVDTAMAAATKPAIVPAEETAAVTAAGEQHRVRARVCAVHGPIPVEKAKPLRGGKYKCTIEGCGRFLGRGEVALRPLPNSNGPKSPVGWREAFRRHELQVRVEMGLARLKALRPLADQGLHTLSAADLFRVSTTYRQGSWLLENLPSIPVNDAVEAVRFFEERAAVALGLPRLIDERNSLNDIVEGLRARVGDMERDVQEKTNRAQGLAATERILEETIREVEQGVGMPRSQILDCLRKFERVRSETHRLSGIAGTLHGECLRSQSDLHGLKTHLSETAAELRDLRGLKGAALDELARKLTLGQVNALWQCVFMKTFAPTMSPFFMR